jgi:IS5 family transposase
LHSPVIESIKVGCYYFDMKTQKQSYRIRSWKQYNAALVARGNLTFWFDEDVVNAWANKVKTGKRGRSPVYTDVALQCMLTLRAVFRLPLRATEGLWLSLVKLSRLALAVPDYSTLCRRQKKLAVEISRSPRQGAIHIVVDSTGLKVFGEGEWKVRQHGWSKRRTWRKLHLAINSANGEILAAAVTTNSVSDGEILPNLLSQIPDPISQVSADGAYDTEGCYHRIGERGARAAIPPRRGARIWQHGNTRKPPLARDENLRAIRHGGRKRWKQEIGYHRRSLAENAMFRIKTLFGSGLNARRFESQTTEALIRCHALNRMTRLGMPDSYRVTA